MQVDDPIGMVPYWAEKARSYAYESDMEQVPFRGRLQRRLLRREPVGVVGAIRP
jgi:acyl-CoA reductase-like NAD-dependent aldehyde dehydrogenase